MPVQLGNTQLYTTDEVAVALDKHINTVKNYLQTGELNAKKISGRWLVDHKTLADFLKETQKLPEAMIGHRLGLTFPKSGAKVQTAHS